MKIPKLRDDRKACCYVISNIIKWHCYCVYGPPTCNSCHIGYMCNICKYLMDYRLVHKTRVLATNK